MTAPVPTGGTVLEVRNEHVDPAPAITVDDGDYVSYFQNALGEQWIFVRRRGAETATLYGGDIGWEGHEVRDRTSDEVRREFERQGVRESMLSKMIAMADPDPLAPNLVLQGEEKAWLNIVWAASSKPDVDQAERLASIAAELVKEVSTADLEKHPNTSEYRGAHQALALLTGHAAGIRGMTQVQAGDLYVAVLQALRDR